VGPPSIVALGRFKRHFVERIASRASTRSPPATGDDTRSSVDVERIARVNTIARGDDAWGGERRDARAGRASTPKSTTIARGGR